MIELINNFYSKVNKSALNGCWEWTGSRDRNNYGDNRTKVLGERFAHRISYKIENGDLSKNICVLHKCDNPPCVNPNHLFVGTISDNNWDRSRKGRSKNQHMGKTHCKNGHEFTKENTYIGKNKSGNFRRLCAACIKNYNQQKYSEKKKQCITSTI